MDRLAFSVPFEGNVIAIRTDSLLNNRYTGIGTVHPADKVNIKSTIRCGIHTVSGFLMPATRSMGLQPGDRIQYSDQQPHALINCSQVDSRILHHGILLHHDIKKE